MESDEVFQNMLRMKEQRPVPLAYNFYEEFLRRNQPMDDTTSTASNTTVQDSTTAKVVQHLLKSNEQLIAKAAMQQAASAVNVTSPQYTNLIPLSFDQEQFIRDFEASNRKKI